MFLCPNNDANKEATQECFDKHPLMISGTREHRYYIPQEAKKKGVFRLVEFLCDTSIYLSSNDQLILAFSNSSYSRWKHMDQHQIPCSIATLRYLYTMRSAMDLLHGQHVGQMFQRHRSGWLWASRDIQKLCWCCDYIEHRRCTTIICWQK